MLSRFRILSNVLKICWLESTGFKVKQAFKLQSEDDKLMSCSMGLFATVTAFIKKLLQML